MIKHQDNHSIEVCISKYPDIGNPQEIVPFKQEAFHNALYDIQTAGGHFVLKLLQTHDRESTEARYEYLASVMEGADPPPRSKPPCYLPDLRVCFTRIPCKR